MSYKYYYQIMGLSEDVSQDEVRCAYHKLAHKYHPDISKDPQAEAKFKELRKAYQILIDPQKRAKYDIQGKQFQVNGDSLRYFLGKLFGLNPSQYGRQPCTDSHVIVYIDLEDSIHGSECNIYLTKPEIDDQGKTEIKHELLNVKIPIGIKPGQTIRLSGHGQSVSKGSKAGDLVLEIAFNRHPLYKVIETDICMDLSVTPFEAKSGIVDLRIPPKSQQASELRIKGCGLPAKIPGDFVVTLQIIRQSENTENANKAYRAVKQSINIDA
ncbi:MAG: DnaJ domain-containing protein [Methylobacter sp.]|nr:DnaJ domain-containing protein [Methylobacter sp.]